MGGSRPRQRRTDLHAEHSFPAARRSLSLHFILGPVLYALATALAFVSVWASLASFALLIVFYVAQGRIPWESVFTPQAVVRDVARDIQGRGAVRPPSRVVPRVGGLQIEWTEPVPLVREFLVRGSTWEEVR